MEQHQEKTTLILKYAKRRFDGGNEAELIRAIERQQDVAQLNKLFGDNNGPGNVSVGINVPLNLTPQQSAQQPVGPKQEFGKRAKVRDAVIRGPLQVCIALVGLLTAGLAIMTFRKQQNSPMLEQSRVVFADCRKTLRKGLWDTVTTPVRVLKIVITKVA